MIEYRLAQASDADAIATLHAESWRDNYRGAFLDSFLDGDLHSERLAVWRERLEHAPENQFVQLGIASGKVAAFICAYAGHHPRWGSLIDNLHVARSFKGSGIGRRLMMHAAAWLHGRNSELGVYLLVLESNTAARRFYERLGGTVDGVSVETLGGTALRSFRYAWPSAAAFVSPNEDGTLRSTR